MPGKHILLENSFAQELIGIDNMMFDLQVKGYRPILAHPERYHYYHDRRDRYKTLHNASVKFQINILSLAGYFGGGSRDRAVWLIQNNLCDMFGSDMHSMDHARIIKDYIGSKDWRKLCEKYNLERRIINDREFAI
jgi:tyrosine-protein phosphatase YwqE